MEKERKIKWQLNLYAGALWCLLCVARFNGCVEGPRLKVEGLGSLELGVFQFTA